jgi:uncharacterized protein DUF4154
LKVARFPWLALLCSLLLHAASAPAATAAAPTEQQVKAVFVYNFTRFAEWPVGSFESPTQPLVIGVLGSDAFAAQLDDVVRGEHVGDHPLQVRRFRNAEEIGDCQILYIDQVERNQLGAALGRLGHRSTLTVSDIEGAARRGVMVEFAKSDNRIRLLINVDSARAAGVTLSSNLLRPAQIVQTAQGN